MAYSRAFKEIELANDAALTSTGEKGDVSPGLTPFLVRRVAAIVTATLTTTTAAVISIRKQSTAGSTATTDRTVISTITIPAGTAKGKVYYVTGLNVKVSPGEELNVVVTTAATTTGTAHIKAEVDPVDEVPGNLTNMVLSA